MEDNVGDGKFTTFEPTHSDVNCEVCGGKSWDKEREIHHRVIYIYIAFMLIRQLYLYAEWIQNVSPVQNQTIM